MNKKVLVIAAAIFCLSLASCDKQIPTCPGFSETGTIKEIRSEERTTVGRMGPHYYTVRYIAIERTSDKSVCIEVTSASEAAGLRVGDVVRNGLR